jgi:membrane protease YdiL (CAAX protease family)
LSWRAFGLLLALVGIFAFWYTLVPRRPVYDAGFLVIAAAPVIERVFGRIYHSPDPHLHLEILGHLMWIRVGLMALLVLRDWDAGPVSFWPKGREWRIGLIWFAIGVLPLSLVAGAVRDLQFTMPQASWRLAAIAVGTFCGGMWVIALSEELFFRGFVERALLDRPVVAIAASAVLFGLVHLWYGHFPNVSRATTAIALGGFCGLAYWHARSIRASMVTHACAIVTMRVLFKAY